jgi:hypothetical protein
MEYLKIWGFQNSTIIAEVESFGILGPKTRYGPLKQKSRAILALPLMYCTNMKLFYIPGQVKLSNKSGIFCLE